MHRLDKDTTGLMVVAKNDRAHRSLAAQFADHGRTGPLRRGYLAFVWGAPDRPKGTIDAPLGRHRQARDKIAVRPDGRPAVTHFEVLETYPGADGKPVASLIACRLETGRTHQIRVHLAHIGHPLLGDDDLRHRLQDQGGTARAGCARGAGGPWKAGPACPYAGLPTPQDRRNPALFKSALPGDLARLRQSLAGGAAERRQTPAGDPKTK